jgi:hypothetical protein
MLREKKKRKTKEVTEKKGIEGKIKEEKGKN